MEINFNSLIAEVKTQANIVDIVSQRGVSVNQSGSRYKSLCPFHNENTPSFIIDEHSQTYHCFGCGESGDVISFVQKFDNTDFTDALRSVGESSRVADLDNKIAAVFSGDNNGSIDYKVLRKCLSVAAEYYKEKFASLKSSHPAVKMVTDRGLPTNAEDMQSGEFYLGYAPKTPTELSTFLTNKGFDEEVLIQTGLARKVDVKGKEVLFDVFSNRLMFAFTDNTGRVIGFSGRKLNEEDYGGKYINSSDTPLFNKSNVIFNFSDAKREIGLSQKVFVVEGQFDVFALREAGIKNVVAVSGTSITDGHIRTLGRAIGSSGKIVFCLDGDKAGILAAIKTIQNHTMVQNRGVTVLFRKGTDPCDVFQEENGIEKLKDLLSKTQKAASTFLVEQCVKGLDLEKATDKQKALNRLSTLCASVNSASFIHLCAQEMAKYVLLSTEDIAQRVKSEKDAKNSKAKSAREEKDSNREESIVSNVIKERFLDVDFEKIESMYAKMKSNQIAAIEIRVLSIIARYPGLKDMLEDSGFEFSFKTTISLYNYLKRLKNRGGLVPENYGKYAPLAACIFFDNSLLPSLHTMSTEDVKEHLDFLLSTVGALKEKERREEKRKEISEFLIKNSHMSIEELAKGVKDLEMSS